MEKQIPKIHHSWDLQPKQAVDLQTQLSSEVIRTSGIKPSEVTTVAGIDAAYRGNVACVAVIVLQMEDLETLEYKFAVRPTDFPYVPGLLSFREGPAILAALDKLSSTPDVLIFDGQGIAHPRRFGIASHIGLLVGIPSIGCAKTVLTGDYKEPDKERGSFSYLSDRGETIGAVVRTRAMVKPVFVSIGHRVNLHDSIKIVLHCCKGYRLPETIRLADKLSRKKLLERAKNPGPASGSTPSRRAYAPEGRTYSPKGGPGFKCAPERGELNPAFATVFGEME